MITKKEIKASEKLINYLRYKARKLEIDLLVPAV